MSAPSDGLPLSLWLLLSLSALGRALLIVSGCLTLSLLREIVGFIEFL